MYGLVECHEKRMILGRAVYGVAAEAVKTLNVIDSCLASERHSIFILKRMLRHSHHFVILKAPDISAHRL